jgi:hypothetical protein
MAKFLWHGSYSERGAKALVEEGGTKRRAGVERAVTAMAAPSRRCTSRSATTTTTPSSTSRTTYREPQ